MGGVISAESDLAENPILKRIAGIEQVSDNDPLWNQLFSFNLKVDDQDSKVAEVVSKSTSALLESLMFNTRTTGNFSALIRVFLRRSSELKDSELYENKIFLWQMGNCLLVIRYICTFLTERLSEAEFVAIFDKHPQSGEESDSDDDERCDSPYASVTEEFVDSLIDILSELPVNDMTLSIHMEGVKCFLVLLSTQLYLEAVTTESLVFSYLLKGPCSLRMADLTRSLLRNYLQHNTEYKRIGNKHEAESIVIGLAASMWSMVQLVAGNTEDDEDEHFGYYGKLPPLSLGSVSLLLILSLACHPTSAIQENTIKDVLKRFQNAQEVSSLVPSSSTSFRLDYNLLYERLCATVCQEPPMLLLYLLLHRNSGFRNYVLSRINLENLVIPVIRILFDNSSSTGQRSIAPSQHQTYLALIVVLILSEDDFFCKLIHETMVSGVDWIEPERPIGEISLGALITLVLVRAIHRNTVKTRDRYLHTNCLAAFANLSGSFKNLSPLSCQKIITLLDVMTKRHAKQVKMLRSSAENGAEEEQEADRNVIHEEITVLEEGIRTVLEILNAAIAGGNLRNNPHLVYTLLYHRELFDSFQRHPMFQDLMVNIEMVVKHFSDKVVNTDKDTKKTIVASGSAVLATIEKESLHWPTDRLKKFPELKFRYVEDDNTVDFFVPYVWRLVVNQSTVHFDLGRVKLFQA